MSEKSLQNTEKQPLTEAEQAALDKLGLDTKEKLVILIDDSGSMGDSYGGRGSRSDAAREALTVLWQKTDWSISTTALYSFGNSTAQGEFPMDCPPTYPEGAAGYGTDFGAALRAGIKEQAHRIILTSDGESQFPNNEVERCKQDGIIVDTIFIGSVGGSGEATLQKISEATGGMFTTAENAEELVQGLLELETSERLMIGGPATEVIKL